MDQMTDEPLVEVVDARSNPELANQMAAAVLDGASSSASGDLPEPPMPTPLPGDAVTLPSGATARIRELTGVDEEKMARVSPKDFLWRQRDLIVRAAVEEFNGEPVTRKDFPDLVIADREALLLAIRIATYGPSLEFEINCPQCNEAQEIEINLDEIEVNPLTATDTQEVELRSGQRAVYTLPRASNEDEAMKMAVNKATGAEVNTRLIAECVLRVGDQPWLGDSSARALKMGDRKRLIEAITEGAGDAGPDYSDLEAECTACGHRASIDVTLSDLFRG